MSYRPTELVIRLDVIAANARAILARLRGKARLMAVVKADAYGHGMVPAAKALRAAGADALAVATVDEAVQLREAGARGSLLVLGGATPEGAEAAVRLHVAQAVFDEATLLALQSAAARLDTVAHAHLKVDTGMNRVGVKGEDALKRLLATWQRCPNVKLEGAFTHFASADADPEFTREQDAAFRKAVGLIRAAGHRPLVHEANSAGILAGTAFWHDMVRPGIALYGAAVADQMRELAPAQRLVTRPERIQWIEPGETVSYGRAWAADRPTRVMTLPIGYGDGYRRILSDRAAVLVAGRRAPLIGRVCMDHVMADVTDIPEAGMASEVVLLGEQGGERITPDEMAAWADTIPYEVMLGFSGRVPRRYE